jgi:hypothetical protein
MTVTLMADFRPRPVQVSFYHAQNADPTVRGTRSYLVGACKAELSFDPIDALAYPAGGGFSMMSPHGMLSANDSTPSMRSVVCRKVGCGACTFLTFGCFLVAAALFSHCLAIYPLPPHPLLTSPRVDA